MKVTTEFFLQLQDKEQKFCFGS